MRLLTQVKICKHKMSTLMQKYIYEHIFNKEIVRINSSLDFSVAYFLV